MEGFAVNVSDQGSVMEAEIFHLRLVSGWGLFEMEFLAGLTICDIRMILLLLLHINPNNASHASCLSIRTPAKRGALLLKLASAADHCS